MRHDPLTPGDDDASRQSDSLNDSAAETTSAGHGGGPPLSRLNEFERIYRAEYGPVVSYFARRYTDPQLVADLTTDTFVAAIQSFDEFDPSRSSPRAWAIGIARRILDRYRESDPRDEDLLRRRALQQLLDRDETKELMWWIDVERSSRDLIDRLERMSKMDREAFELVDICELSPAEAARELGISTQALRLRVLRTRARLSREGGSHE
jgi:RNA polymerase sigma factor (sigma-70 family)